MVRICFVCLGNICRSPTAEGVMKHLLEERGLSNRVEVDSAGTAAYHAGEPADRRSRETANRRGVPLSSIARKVVASDFSRFDLIVAMDQSNYDDLLDMARDEHRSKIHLFRNFDPDSPRDADVPDPYYGGQGGFDEVFDICRAAAEGLLQHLHEQGLLR